METLSARLADLRKRLDALSVRTRVAGAMGLAALIAAGIFTYARSTEVRYEVLFAHLTEEDAAQIVARLRDLHTPYQLGEEGTSVLVPSSSVHETRLSLAAEGLPSGGGVGFELFDRQRFGESEFSEQVQFRRALEGELARTIRHISGVESARVHLVLPQRSLFASNESGASASVALRLRTGFRPSADQVRGIVHLVAGSVRDLDPSRVTIVDGNGRSLSTGGEEEEQGTRSAEELRERIEEARESAVQQLLDATFGPGTTAVEISAELSFAREERVEESYDPDRVATRSFQITEQGTPPAETASTQGIPGAASALPGGSAAEPAAGVNGGGGHQRSEVRNFEITKVVTRAVEPLGRLTRLTAAVLVDGRWEGEGEARHFVPKTAEELERIKAVVASAAGLREARGDVVTVECIPFAGNSVEASSDAAEGDEAPLGNHLPWWAYVAAVGGIVLLAGGTMVAMRRRRKDAAPDAFPDALPSPEEMPRLAGPAIDIAALEEKSEEMDPDEVRKLVVEVARTEPDAAARIIRGWLAEGMPS